MQERINRSEKMEALGHLAGGVAHDLNNVLGVTMAYAEIMKEKTEAGSQLRKCADSIFTSTEKAAAMIQDLLTLARRGVPVSEVVDLNHMVSNVLKSAEYNVLRDFHPRVDFRAILDREPLLISGSQIHLEKTVLNLISNAAESISGRGDVTIGTERQYLDKPIHGYDEVREGEYAVLTVKDTGGGIRPEDLGRIFEPFFTRKKMGRSGTGLGLAIAWGTVKDHEGYIDVESEPGKGTAFSLYFPVTKEKKRENDQGVIPVERYLGDGESVLVVDDVAGQREIAVEILTQLRYEVKTASCGEEAVEYLKQNSADIVILDMIMDPGMDGLDTYRAILTVNPKQKAIIVSGFSETERVKEALRLGAGAYVKKPYLRGRIGIALRRELERA
jgi:nitrogen-specific signal transduction histidine kinase